MADTEGDPASQSWGAVHPRCRRDPRGRLQEEPHPKIEARRRALGSFFREDETLLAVGTTLGLAVPRLSLDDIAGLADLIVNRVIRR